MPRYIDAYKIPYHDLSDGRGKCEVAFLEDIIKVPTADVRENIKGKWQPIEVQPYFKKHFDTSVACSVCHRKGNKRWNFCPNCGADMRDEAND